jgi:hypothetical protein
MLKKGLGFPVPKGVIKHMVSSDRWLIYLCMAGFLTGFTTHVIDLIGGGFLPYDHVPLWKNIFWSSLTVIDFFVILLLFYQVIPGLLLANLVMMTDVLINTSAYRFFDHYKIQLQIIFSIFVLITTAIILVKRKRN